MKKHLQETTDFLISNGFENPEVGIVLGTGLGQLLNEIDILKEVSYSDIPHFPEATVEFHSGKASIWNLVWKDSGCHVWQISLV